MKKQDLIAALIIGEVSALIFWWISKSLELSTTIFTALRVLSIISPLFIILGTQSARILFRSKPAIYQASKTFSVGVLNTFIDLGVLNVLIAVSGITSGNLYLTFVAVSFIVATVNSYFWNKFWTFSRKETKAGGKELIKFFVVTGGGLLIHILVSFLLVNVMGPQFGLNERLWANVGKIAAAFLAFIWNFTGFKLIVFKK